jgi:hypothetical protein
MSPVFDNGTSLGYEPADEALAAPWPAARLAAYIGRGTHHCSLNDATKGTPHVELCKMFLETYPSAGVEMRKVILCSDSVIDEIVHWCTGFDLPAPFTINRAAFVGRLVKARRDQLAQALGA